MSDNSISADKALLMEIQDVIDEIVRIMVDLEKRLTAVELMLIKKEHKEE